MNNILLLILLIFPKEINMRNVINMGNVVNRNINPYETVTLTTYSATEGETDSTPNITASGFKIDTTNPKKHRIIAISRDLKKKWKFGTKVRIKNAGKYNGVYVVKDVMNKRYKKRIDILINREDKQTTISGVKIKKHI
jgi:3D (Asp-Asp-Asp) domain-containing protein